MKKNVLIIGAIAIAVVVVIAIIAIVLLINGTRSEEINESIYSANTMENSTAEAYNDEESDMLVIIVEGENEETSLEELENEETQENEEHQEEKPAETPVPNNNNNSSNSNTNNTAKTGSSPYYIKVNNEANVVTIYAKDDEGYYTKPIKAMVCSTGRATPTSGTYSIKGRWEWLNLINGVYGHYSTQIVGNILFHSVPYTEKWNPGSLEYWEYDKLGTACSAGCVRLTIADAWWIFDYVPQGTLVEFYYDSNPGPLGKPSAQKISDNVECRNWDPTDGTEGNPWHKPTPTPTPTPTPSPSPTPSPTLTITPTVTPKKDNNTTTNNTTNNITNNTTNSTTNNSSSNATNNTITNTTTNSTTNSIANTTINNTTTNNTVNNTNTNAVTNTTGNNTNTTTNTSKNNSVTNNVLNEIENKL